MIARCAQAAKRHVARRARGRPVAVDDAGAAFLDHAPPQRLVLRDEPGGEAEAGSVGRGDRRVEIGDANDRQHRREDFRVRRVDPGEVEDRVAALSDAEAQQMADQLDQMPAGASVRRTSGPARTRFRTFSSSSLGGGKRS